MIRDVDRLLAAADICEQPYAFSGFKEPDPFAVALAALLRAVADRDTPGKSEEWKVAQIINAAADLADTILGVGDE